MANKPNQASRIILPIMLWLLFIFSPVIASDTLKEAAKAFNQGDYIGSIKLTSELIEQTQKPKQQIIALIRRGEAYRKLGHLHKASSDLSSAYKLAEQQQQEILQSIAGLSLGQLLYQQQNYARASEVLSATQKLANKTRQLVIEAAASNSLANILSRQQRNIEAIDNYRTALELAEKSKDLALIVTSRRNLAKALGDGDEASRLLKTAGQEALNIPDPYERAELLLSIAGDNLQSYALLDEVIIIAKQLDSPRLLSSARGQLAAVYEGQQRYKEALGLTQQAIVDAQQINADDLLLKWHWQSGRLLKQLEKNQAAISSYRQAIYYINRIRHDLPVSYQGGQSSFRETLSPIYTGLADLLLQQSETINKTAAKNNSQKQQELLREARDTIERIKLSEFQDYFQNACIASRTEKLETLASDTAVLYPIILPDRLELLINIEGKLTRYSSPISKQQLENAVNQLISTLRSSPSGQLYAYDLITSRQLYQWIINPVLDQLNKQKIDTLVFVPDGIFRSLPIAALNDGKHYLVEQYAIATVPGLTLFDPRALAKENMQTLLTGLSQPGDVVLELPDAMWNSALKKSRGLYNRELRGVEVTTEQLKQQSNYKSNNKPILKRKADFANQVQQALALPGVKKEISQLSTRLKGKTLMDNEFLLDSFSKEVGKQPYRIVHIASHGFFGGVPEHNFLMTYDRKLNMNQLGDILKPKKLAELPIELLTLSACQTAAGDDRSPLGIAGIALESGARSILGTLWPIADEAAQQMLPNFYDKLLQPGQSKAKALQSAQLKLLKQDKFAHPFYWSAFILIGNWL